MPSASFFIAYFCAMANNAELEALYNHFNSKNIEELQIVLEWFEKGNYKNEQKLIEQLKEEITKKPITFKSEQTKQKELFEKIIKHLL
jgi:hypothetical protein